MSTEAQHDACRQTTTLYPSTTIENFRGKKSTKGLDRSVEHLIYFKNIIYTISPNPTMNTELKVLIYCVEQSLTFLNKYVDSLFYQNQVHWLSVCAIVLDIINILSYRVQTVKVML